ADGAAPPGGRGDPRRDPLGEWQAGPADGRAGLLPVGEEHELRGGLQAEAGPGAGRVPPHGLPVQAADAAGPDLRRLRLPRRRPGPPEARHLDDGAASAQPPQRPAGDAAVGLLRGAAEARGRRRPGTAGGPGVPAGVRPAPHGEGAGRGGGAGPRARHRGAVPGAGQCARGRVRRLTRKEGQMETATMGRVITPAVIENVSELYFAEKGIIPPEQVHRVEVSDALVDTGPTYIGMPRRLIEQLGFTKPYRTRTGQTAKGECTSGMYGPVRLTVQDRIYHGDVAEVDEGCRVLIGQLALEGLDLVVDPKGQRLIGNPEHGGQHIIEMY